MASLNLLRRSEAGLLEKYTKVRAHHLNDCFRSKHQNWGRGSYQAGKWWLKLRLIRNLRRRSSHSCSMRPNSISYSLEEVFIIIGLIKYSWDPIGALVRCRRGLQCYGDGLAWWEFGRSSYKMQEAVFLEDSAINRRPTTIKDGVFTQQPLYT